MNLAVQGTVECINDKLKINMVEGMSRIHSTLNRGERDKINLYKEL